MPQEDATASPKASDLLAKARNAAETLDFDSAISALIACLYLDPEATEVHAELRRVALKRFQHDGAEPTESDLADYRQATTPLDMMLAAEKLFAKQPSHLHHAERLLRASVTGQYKNAATWIADLLFLANNKCPKPSLEAYVFLKENYAEIGAYDRAMMACKRAMKLNPQDRALVEELRELTNLYSRSPKKQTPQDTHAIEVKFEGMIAPPKKGGAAEKAARPTPPPPAETDTHQDAAQLFFKKGKDAAESGHFDYAIDLFIQGLRKDPEALESGHLELCRVGLKRQAQGGKKPSMVDRAKALYGKKPLEQMLNAETLFAKDPYNISFAEAILKAAIEGDYTKTAGWIANLIFQTNNLVENPSFQTYQTLKESYKRLGQFDKAVAACQRAMHLKPDHENLAEEYKNLTAELTMVRGRYKEPGDFRKAIKDPEKQEVLYAQDRVVKTQDWRLLAVKEAREGFAQNPKLPKALYNLADALADLDTDQATAEALSLLETAYQEQKNFSFREKAGKLRIKTHRQQLRQAQKAQEAHAENNAASLLVQSLRQELAELELGHYRDCVKNYPTDRKFKYEYGLRLIHSKQYDEAIPYFQESSKDPGRKIAALNQIGLCFFGKGWLADAIDVFAQAIEEHELRDDDVGKELRYHLARCHEDQKDGERALEIYRKIAQSDFSYRDVSERVGRLREAGQ